MNTELGCECGGGHELRLRGVRQHALVVIGCAFFQLHCAKPLERPPATPVSGDPGARVRVATPSGSKPAAATTAQHVTAKLEQAPPPTVLRTLPATMLATMRNRLRPQDSEQNTVPLHRQPWALQPTDLLRLASGGTLELNHELLRQHGVTRVWRHHVQQNIVTSSVTLYGDNLTRSHWQQHPGSHALQETQHHFAIHATADALIPVGAYGGFVPGYVETVVALDELGRVVASSTRAADLALWQEQHYDRAGNLRGQRTMAKQHETIASFSYDAAGQLRNAESNDAVSWAFSYHPGGQLATALQSDATGDTQTRFQWNARGALANMTRLHSGRLLGEWKFTYGSDGLPERLDYANEAGKAIEYFEYEFAAQPPRMPTGYAKLISATDLAKLARHESQRDTAPVPAQTAHVRRIGRDGTWFWLPVANQDADAFFDGDLSTEQDEVPSVPQRPTPTAAPVATATPTTTPSATLPTMPTAPGTSTPSAPLPAPVQPTSPNNGANTTVATTNIATNGSLTTEEIAAALAAHHSVLAPCKYATNNPTVELHVAFRVSRAGSVSVRKVWGHAHATDRTCLKNALQQIRFAKQNHGTSVKAQLTLTTP